MPKSHIRIESYGTVDELNSHIGFCSDLLGADTLLNSKADEPASEKSLSACREMLKEIQDRLFTIGSSLACDPEKEPKLRIPDLKAEDIRLLEDEIDRMNDALPPMKSFILPGGHMAVSALHVARCVCRRAERLCVQLQESSDFIDPLVIQYLNRLSDYLFVLSRYAGHLLGVAEIPWKPRV